MSKEPKPNEPEPTPKFRLVAFGTPEVVEAIKRQEFNKLTTTQRLDLYMQQLAEWHNFDEIRLERTLRITKFD